jgi:diaphanous 2
MPENQVITEFNKMLENMNLSEEKKKPLEKLPISAKRNMLSLNYKNVAGIQFRNPIDYIQYLSDTDLRLTKKLSCIESLRVALTSNSLEWIQEFGSKGLKEVLGLLNECFRWNDSKWYKVQHECIKCLKAIMNNKVGLADTFEHKEALTLVARSLNPDRPLVMLDSVKVMAAVCCVPPIGHEKALEAITIAGELREESIIPGQPTPGRFSPIVQGLLISNNEQLRTNSLTLINAIVSTPDDLEFRMHLRRSPN